MANNTEKINSSEYWYFILPTAILLILSFFVYTIFHVSSIQIVDSQRVFEIVKKLSRPTNR